MKDKHKSVLALKTCIAAHTTDTGHLKECCFFRGCLSSILGKSKLKLMLGFFLSSWFYRNMNHHGKQSMSKLLLSLLNLPAMEYVVPVSSRGIPKLTLNTMQVLFHLVMSTRWNMAQTLNHEIFQSCTGETKFAKNVVSLAWRSECMVYLNSR